MIGDTVLLPHTAYKGKHMIQDQWENTIYEVVEQPFKNMPVFKIKPQGGDESENSAQKSITTTLIQSSGLCW